MNKTCLLPTRVIQPGGKDKEFVQLTKGEQWLVHAVCGSLSRQRGWARTNSVTTSKYTLVTFVPRSLFEQFRRLANQYFLLISILMLLGGVFWYSPIDAYSTIGPLTLIVALTMAKEGAEDLKRHRSDRETNDVRRADVLDASPGVGWDDIAGLAQAPQSTNSTSSDGGTRPASMFAMTPSSTVIVAASRPWGRATRSL